MKFEICSWCGWRISDAQMREYRAGKPVCEECTGPCINDLVKEREEASK